MMKRPLSTALPGFADPVFDSQSVFRTILDALARPGRIASMPCDPLTTPDGLNPAAASICLCLLDPSTCLWLDSGVGNSEIQAFLKFHSGCSIVSDPQAASFAILSDIARISDVHTFNQGTPEYPDRSTTVIVQVDDLAEGTGTTLTGPGIERERRLDVAGFTDEGWRTLAMNNAQYPLGVDILFAADTRLAGLPRSVRIGV